MQAITDRRMVVVSRFVAGDRIFGDRLVNDSACFGFLEIRHGGVGVMGAANAIDAALADFGFGISDFGFRASEF